MVLLIKNVRNEEGIMTKIKLPVEHMLLTGLSIHRGCREMIDEIYNEKPTVYYERYLNSSYRNDIIKRIFTMESEEKFNQLVGILDYSEERGDTLLIERIIRSVYPPLVNFVKKSTVVYLSKFYKQYKLEQISEEDNFTYGACLIYLAMKKGKQVANEGFATFVLSKWERYVKIAVTGEQKGTVGTPTPQQEAFKQQWIESGEKLFTPYMMERLKKESMTVAEFVSSEIEFQTLRSLGVENYWDMENLYNVLTEDYEKARRQQFQGGFNRYIGCYSRYLSRLGVDSHDMLVDVELTREKLDLMFEDFGLSVRDNQADEKEQALYIASALLIYNLVQHYQRIKEDYLGIRAEKQYLELQTLDASLKEEYRKFEELKSEQEEAFNAQQRELEQLRQKVKALEVENKKMQVAQEKAESYIKSLEAEAGEVNESFNNLKTQLVETQQRLSNQSTLSLDEKVAFLNRYRIGMFGGRQNIRELSNTLENINFYDALNEDLSSIQGLDVVFMNTDYINHAFTSKIRSMSEKLGVPTRYITGVNRELLIGAMYEELQSFEK